MEKRKKPSLSAQRAEHDAQTNGAVGKTSLFTERRMKSKINDEIS